MRKSRLKNNHIMLININKEVDKLDIDAVADEFVCAGE